VNKANLTFTLQYLDNNELDDYILNRKQVKKSKKNFKTHKPFFKYNFTHNYEKDYYLCPNIETLEYKKTYNAINIRQYYTNKCLNCPNQI